MKRVPQIFVITVLMFAAVPLFCAELQPAEDRYEYNKIITSLETTGAPQVTDNYIIFTAELGPRFVGIAFDFENYKIIHPFNIRNKSDIDGQAISSLMFYLLERPGNLSEISYRLIIDGLWTADPLNPNKIYDYNVGIWLSKVAMGSTLPPVTKKADEGVHFIYEGAAGQKVRLAGSFTNWDSWIYELQETKPGFYELTLPLPEGKYYYNYYLGMTAVVDKTNPLHVYTNDGRRSSVIEVK